MRSHVDNERYDGTLMDIAASFGVTEQRAKQMVDLALLHAQQKIVEGEKRKTVRMSTKRKAKIAAKTK